MPALDFSSLGALSGVENWGEIRAGRERDAQRIAILNSLAQQKNQQQQASAQEIQNHLDTVSKIKVLDQDHQRIQAKEQELSASIQDGVRANHGNVSKFLETGGRTILNKYQNDLEQSEEVQTGLRNSINHNMAVSDQQKGLNLRNTAWKEGDKQVQGTYGENYAAYEAGKTGQLNYSGAYKTPDIGDLQEEFGKIPGPETPDGKPRPVSANEVYQKVLDKSSSKGLDDQDAITHAHKIASAYDADVKAGRRQPYMYKGTLEEMSKRQAMFNSTARLEMAVKAQQEKLKNQGSFQGDVLGKITTPQAHGGYALPVSKPVNVHAYLEQFGQKPDLAVPPDAKKLVQMFQTEFPDKTWENSFAKTKLGGLEYHKPKKGEEWEGYTGKVKNGDQAISAETLQKYPSNLNDYPGHVTKVQGTVSLPSPDGKGNKLYAKITYHFDNQNDMGQGGWFGMKGGFGATNSHAFWPDSETGASQGDVSGSKHDLTMLVPVDYGKDENGQEIDPLGSRQFNFDRHNQAAQKYATQDDEFMAGAKLGSEDNSEE